MIIMIRYLLCHQRERNRTYNLHFGVLSFPYGRPLHFWSRCLSGLLFSAQTRWAWGMMGQYLPCMNLLGIGVFLIIHYHIMPLSWKL